MYVRVEGAESQGAQGLGFMEVRGLRPADSGFGAYSFAVLEAIRGRGPKPETFGVRVGSLGDA